jgi:hypothetical protein
MTPKSLARFLAIAVAATGVTSPLAAKPKKHKPVAPAHAWSAPIAQQGARMIEVRPGLWISSYGCISDEGYGRYSPCDVSESNR